MDETLYQVTKNGFSDSTCSGGIYLCLAVVFMNQMYFVNVQNEKTMEVFSPSSPFSFFMHPKHIWLSKAFTLINNTREASLTWAAGDGC